MRRAAWLSLAAACSAAEGDPRTGFLVATRAPMPRREDWVPLAITAAGVVFGFPLLTSIAMRYVEAVHASVIVVPIPARWGAWRTCSASTFLICWKRSSKRRRAF